MKIDLVAQGDLLLLTLGQILFLEKKTWPGILFESLVFDGLRNSGAPVVRAHSSQVLLLVVGTGRPRASQ